MMALSRGGEITLADLVAGFVESTHIPQLLLQVLPSIAAW